MNRALLLGAAPSEGSTTWLLLSHHAREVCVTAAVLGSFFFFLGLCPEGVVGAGNDGYFYPLFFFQIDFLCCLQGRNCQSCWLARSSRSSHVGHPSPGFLFLSQ